MYGQLQYLKRYYNNGLLKYHRIKDLICSISKFLSASNNIIATLINMFAFFKSSLACFNITHVKSLSLVDT